nr:MAG TPA: hypothetical protein [Caudoviricetes sp.]
MVALSGQNNRARMKIRALKLSRRKCINPIIFRKDMIPGTIEILEKLVEYVTRCTEGAVECVKSLIIEIEDNDKELLLLPPGKKGNINE